MADGSASLTTGATTHDIRVATQTLKRGVPKLGHSLHRQTSACATRSFRMAWQDHRSRRAPSGGVRPPAAGRVEVVTSASTTRSLGQEWETRCDKMATPDCFDRSDPSCLTDRAYPDTLTGSAPSGSCGPTAVWESRRTAVGTGLWLVDENRFAFP
jgi:hypothetical protein